MNNILKGSLFFISGAAIASFITYKVVEKKFKDIADEEIASVKAVYERKIKKLVSEKHEEVLIKADKNEEVEVAVHPYANVNPYTSLVNNLGYSGDEKEEQKDMKDDNIVVIPPEDFGEYGYICESLTYYADKILTLDDDTKIDDVVSFVGPNALNTFGEYEDDSVFVRNHKMKTDFEILLDSRRYSDVVSDDDE